MASTKTLRGLVKDYLLRLKRDFFKILFSNYAGPDIGNTLRVAVFDSEISRDPALSSAFISLHYQNFDLSAPEGCQTKSVIFTVESRDSEM